MDSFDKKIKSAYNQTNDVPQDFDWESMESGIFDKMNVLAVDDTGGASINIWKVASGLLVLLVLGAVVFNPFGIISNSNKDIEHQISISTDGILNHAKQNTQGINSIPQGNRKTKETKKVIDVETGVKTGVETDKKKLDIHSNNKKYPISNKQAVYKSNTTKIGNENNEIVTHIVDDRNLIDINTKQDIKANKSNVRKDITSVYSSSNVIDSNNNRNKVTYQEKAASDKSTTDRTNIQNHNDFIFADRKIGINPIVEVLQKNEIKIHSSKVKDRVSSNLILNKCLPLVSLLQPLDYKEKIVICSKMITPLTYEEVELSPATSIKGFAIESMIGGNTLLASNVDEPVMNEYTSMSIGISSALAAVYSTPNWDFSIGYNRHFTRSLLSYQDESYTPVKYEGILLNVNNVAYGSARETYGDTTVLRKRKRDYVNYNSIVNDVLQVGVTRRFKISEDWEWGVNLGINYAFNTTAKGVFLNEDTSYNRYNDDNIGQQLGVSTGMRLRYNISSDWAIVSHLSGSKIIGNWSVNNKQIKNPSIVSMGIGVRYTL